MALVFCVIFAIGISIKEEHKSVYETVYNHFTDHQNLMKLISETSITLQ
jgi:hypothetical protein